MSLIPSNYLVVRDTDLLEKRLSLASYLQAKKEEAFSKLAHKQFIKTT